ncbi:hypothetical protein CDL12_17041 [Handroanthus impetiginosus]|uniref:Ubiquitinyl hydrolase 1 n=1 Tax=Handroanthus impetiginosus TaxID=429701 RepID=A0A2G9GYL4_9LAMI|nr:hypothetical protein CDL12_17041 [Handroanthus impetiginosus]
MGHYCILIPRPRDEEVCRSRRKSEEISRRLHCWVDAQKLIEFPQLYWWGECKLPNKVHDADDRLKSITAEMVFEFNPTSQELCLLNSDSAVAAIVRAKDQEIKELKKRVAELEAAANKDLCVVAPAKVDAGATKEQRDRGAACEERRRMRKMRRWIKKGKMMKMRKRKRKRKRKLSRMSKRKRKSRRGRTIRKVKRKMVKMRRRKRRKVRKRRKEKIVMMMRSTKHRADQVSCHHEVEMNKKLEAISRKLDFGQDVNFGKWNYEAIRTLSSIIDDLKLNVKAFEKYN